MKQIKQEREMRGSDCAKMKIRIVRVRLNSKSETERG